MNFSLLCCTLSAMLPTRISCICTIEELITILLSNQAMAHLFHSIHIMIIYLELIVLTTDNEKEFTYTFKS